MYNHWEKIEGVEVENHIEIGKEAMFSAKLIVLPIPKLDAAMMIWNLNSDWMR